MHDVVVIGGGLGGLLTAAILGRRGKQVLVLERAAEVGGRLRSTEIDGYVLDAGAYLWPNLHLDRALDAAAGAADAFAVRSFRRTACCALPSRARRRRRLVPGRSAAPPAAAAPSTLRADATLPQSLRAVERRRTAAT
jgi:phytoene dehydrogenase-like protein